jgi:hypothetical protein
MPSSILASLGLMVLSSCASAAPSPSASVPEQQVSEAMMAPSPGSTVSIDASQKAAYPLAPEEKKPLLAQWKKALASEEKALDQQDRGSVKEFAAAQSQQLKDWRNQEKRERRVFFDQHLSGPDRRDYVQSYITRKKEFDQKQKDDAMMFKMTLKEKHDVFKVNQKNRDLQFKAMVEKSIRPDRSLWPQTK